MVEKYSASRTNQMIEGFQNCLRSRDGRAALRDSFLNDPNHNHQISCESQGIDYQRVRATLIEELKEIEALENGQESIRLSQSPNIPFFYPSLVESVSEDQE